MLHMVTLLLLRLLNRFIGIGIVFKSEFEEFYNVLGYCAITLSVHRMDA